MPSHRALHPQSQGAIIPSKENKNPGMGIGGFTLRAKSHHGKMLKFCRRRKGIVESWSVLVRALYALVLLYFWTHQPGQRDALMVWIGL